ncbi:6-pyruvoyl trahydropterin synthase family protein [Aureimonas phyllosphaerae]|uniref:6-carboxy-5,6,7,8-tetrahydropterin synthase n=1 Tax=Aureimonas phyllosphaerae TaxID=1166078 RepID=A0A7W6BVX0_9HYPH|nr:6-carboxytetrahydropterin synthase [Aureimonas phyllosphaerae]MBB3935710.1 6-pyruvoyl-tetrahydropterin synthase [Aureimonas phyllosphaerae]MBB3959718.1 6-pyruvoyl-tetrahydropterin synthase [Aureimonas phyllosphaerae]SFF14159.1 6-pyruvoyl-tetrahydropterin synthase [Aureimonas phyllosphaerae]
MYAVEVRDHIMIAHSLPRPVFGPAQGMHGATFEVDAAFFTREVDADGLGVDMGLAIGLLKEVLAPLNYQNLDELEIFRGRVTTTEVLSRHVFDALAAKIREGAFGPGNGRIERIRVTLHESHVARAWYEGEL